MSIQGEPTSNPYESPCAKQKQQRGGLLEFTLRARITLSFVLSMTLGAGVWGLSPFLTGHKEPWDASSPMYFLSLLIGGFSLAMICPRLFWVPVLGIYFGQVAYCLFFQEVYGEMIILVFLSVAFFGVPPAFLGAIIAFAGSLIWKWSHRKDTPPD
jgi:hypothetical protein